MMPVVTSAQMREADARCAEEFGVPTLLLMENAGAAVADAVAESVPAGSRVVVLCGTGNNGGDGFVAARHLARAGYRVEVFLAGSVDKVSGDARTNLTAWMRIGGLRTLPEETAALSDALGGAAAVVDAVLGTGLEGPPRGAALAAVQMLRGFSGVTVAVDLPSGVSSDTGWVPGDAVRATRTVCLGALKVGAVVYPGAAFCGQVAVADIGMPPGLLENVDTWLVLDADAAALLPPRPRDAHKGTFGRVLVVGGSVGMSGAPAMCGLASLRAGAGLVKVAVPASIRKEVAGHAMELMTLGLPETGGALAAEGLEILLEEAARADVVAVGPGLSLAPGAAEVTSGLRKNLSVPMVIDADGLAAFAGDPAYARGASPCVLTPHPGEMARLMGCSVEEVQSDRLGAARSAAERSGCVVVLKGAGTIVASPEGRAAVNSTGNSGMATAGSGDVLTGLIAGLLAQGLGAWEAAVLGVYLHGLAGDLAAERVGERALLAGDVLGQVPEAWRTLEGLVS